MRHYNRSPGFVVTSATIANPLEHVQQLLGVSDVVLVDEDGSPHGPRRFVLWNPPLMFKAAVSTVVWSVEMRYAWALSGDMHRQSLDVAVPSKSLFPNLGTL